ncbi:MAG: hypothetical protein AAF485_31285 [Chloroflexota bacterium]
MAALENAMHGCKTVPTLAPDAQPCVAFGLSLATLPNATHTVGDFGAESLAELRTMHSLPEIQMHPNRNGRVKTRPLALFISS